MAEEQGAFDFDAVAEAMVDKMVRRHPHVFAGPNTEKMVYADVEEQTAAWDAIKAAERAGKERHSILDDVPPGLPAMTRAVKLTKRAARVGFDWPSTDQVMAKLREELEELQVEIDASDLPKARAELGDLLFVVANLARKLDVDPEDALRASNAKFERRFHHIEKALTERGKRPDQSNLEEMDGLWDEAKALERKAL
jgi:tetrapyrrole methylase family protein/MazG family protein/ATP diphosphatase